MMKHKIAFIVAGVLMLLAAFMRFALVGYGFLALVFGAVAAAVVLLALLPVSWKIVLAVMIAAFLALFGYWEVRIVKAAKTDAPADADYLIVLGCGIHGTTPSIAMRNRTDAAAAYLLANPGTIAICSGGQGPGEDLTEALGMQQFICAKGVDKSRVLLEDKATSTEENLLFSVDVIKGDLAARGLDANALADQVIVVCSSEYHIFRAQYMTSYLFEDDAGMLQLPFPGLAAHSTLPVSRINYYMREAAGMIVVKVLRH